MSCFHTKLGLSILVAVPLASVLIALLAFARPVQVSEIIDGDTVRLSDGELVRLLGIDTPEHGEPFFDEASNYLTRSILGRELELTFDYTRRDHYHRLLGYVWLNDTLVNLQLVRNGLARVYAWPPDTLYYRKLVRAQTRARYEHVGIWSLPPPPTESLYVIHAARFRFHRPSCAAASSADSTVAISRDSLLDLGFSPCRSCRP